MKPVDLLLQDFDVARSTACVLHERIEAARQAATYHASTDFDFAWSLYTPWISYSAVETPLALDDLGVRLQLSLGAQGPSSEVPVGSKASELRFLMATWAADGTWLGVDDLGGELQLCGPRSQESLSWRRVGVSYEVSGLGTRHDSGASSQASGRGTRHGRASPLHDAWSTMHGVVERVVCTVAKQWISRCVRSMGTDVPGPCCGLPTVHRASS